MRARPHLPGLDGVRGLAALAVFFDHVEEDKDWIGLKSLYGNQAVSIGRQGVEVFFVLSGFLITYLLLHERAATRTVSLVDFYARRTLRIWPVYFLMVLVVFVAIPWLHPHAPAQVYAASDGFVRTMDAAGDPRIPLYVFFLPNLAFWLHPHVLCGAHLWSIGVEEQFYVVWPVIFRYVRWPLAVFLALVVGKIVALDVLVQHPDIAAPYMSSHAIFVTEEFMKWCHYEAMAVGAAAAHVAVRWGDVLARWIARAPIATTILAWSGLVVGFVVAGHNHGFVGSSRVTELPMLGYAIFILIVSQRRTKALLLDNKWLTWLGQRSYGFYTYHTVWLVFGLSVLEWIGWLHEGARVHVAFYVLGFAFAAGAAALSFRFFERPILRLKDRYFTGERREDASAVSSTS